MSKERFRALVLDRPGEQVAADVRDLSVEDLPVGDVLVRVVYSDLNYKDGLAVMGRPGVIRTYPMVPGIDLVGTVADSGDPRFAAGDAVIVTGFGTGERHWGGYAGMARLNGDWLVPLPEGLDPRAAMTIGTAGLTAMLAVMALEEHGLAGKDGDVLVTGGAGGVGSCAIAILRHLGYSVTAATRRNNLADSLQALGAAHVIAPDEIAPPGSRPLEAGRWAGAIDAVGGDVLANTLRTLKPGCSVAVCGNAGGNQLHTTVLPLILRGVNLLGIDSNYCSIPRRREAWNRLVRQLPIKALENVTEVIGLEDVPRYAAAILEGQVAGRVVVDVNR